MVFQALHPPTERFRKMMLVNTDLRICSEVYYNTFQDHTSSALEAQMLRLSCGFLLAPLASNCSLLCFQIPLHSKELVLPEKKKKKTQYKEVKDQSLRTPSEASSVKNIQCD
jgi:hypothetical protein